MLAAPTFFPGQSQKPKWHLLISSRLCDVGGGSAAPPAPAPSSCYWSGPLPTRFQWKPEGGGGDGGRREAKGARSLCRWGWGPGLAQQEASDQVRGRKTASPPPRQVGSLPGPALQPTSAPVWLQRPALLAWDWASSLLVKPGGGVSHTSHSCGWSGSWCCLPRPHLHAPPTGPAHTPTPSCPSTL